MDSSRKNKVLGVIERIREVQKPVSEFPLTPEKTIFTVACEALVEHVGCELGFVAKIDLRNNNWRIVAAFSKDRGDSADQLEEQTLPEDSLVGFVGGCAQDTLPLRLVDIEDHIEIEALTESDKYSTKRQFLSELIKKKLITNSKPYNWIGAQIRDESGLVFHVIVLHNKRKKFCKYFSSTDSTCLVSAARICEQSLRLRRVVGSLRSVLDMEFPGDLEDQDMEKFTEQLKAVIPSITLIRAKLNQDIAENGFVDINDTEVFIDTVPLDFDGEKIGDLIVSVAPGAELTPHDRITLKIFAEKLSESLVRGARKRRRNELFVKKPAEIRNILVRTSTAPELVGEANIDDWLKKLLREYLEKANLLGCGINLKNRGTFILSRDNIVEDFKIASLLECKSQISGEFRVHRLTTGSGESSVLIYRESDTGSLKKGDLGDISGQFIEILSLRDRYYSAFPTELSCLYWKDPSQTPWQMTKMDHPPETVTLCYDLRKSTHIMALAGEDAFKNWLIPLIDELRICASVNGGIFDKFTGDGVLVHFLETSANCSVEKAYICAERMMGLTEKKIIDLNGHLHFGLRGIGAGIAIDVAKANWSIDERGNPLIVGGGLVGACRMCDGTPAGSLQMSNVALAKWTTFNKSNSLTTSLGFAEVPLKSKDHKRKDGLYVWQKKII